MIDVEAKQFRDLPSWQPPEELLKLEFPTPTVLAEFIQLVLALFPTGRDRGDSTLGRNAMEDSGQRGPVALGSQ